MAGVVLAGGAFAFAGFPAHGQSTEPEEVIITNVRAEPLEATCDDPQDLVCVANGDGAGPGEGNGPGGPGGGDGGEGE